MRYRKMRDKLLWTSGPAVILFSPPTIHGRPGWGGKFGMRIGPSTQTLLTPYQARRLAEALLDRADMIEAAKTASPREQR